MRHRRSRSLIAAVLALGCSTEPAPAPGGPSPNRTAPGASARAPAATAPVRVEVWHDAVCPWCRIGLHNLEVAVAAVTATPTPPASPVSVEVIYHPYLLDPDTPPEGRDLRAYLAGKLGAAEVEPALERVSRAGGEHGVRFEWSSVTVVPRTVAAHALIEAAPPARRPAVVAALHHAYFDEGRDLGDATVLASIAATAGLDGEAMRAAVTDPARLEELRARARAATRRGISGVPHFEIAGRALRGAQSAATLRAAIEAAASR